MTDLERVLKWKNSQVLSYLETYKMSGMIDIFKSHHINGKDLLSLTERELKDELSITNLHARKKLFRHIAKLQKESQIKSTLKY